MAHWSYILTDLVGNPIAELENLKERKVNIPLGRIRSGSFVVDASHPWCNTLREVSDFNVKIYRENNAAEKKLMAQGPLLTTEKARTSGTGSIQVNWVGIAANLGLRLIEASKKVEGVEYGYPTPQDMGQMLVSIINGLNAAPLVEPTSTGIMAPFNVANPAPSSILALSTLPQCNTGIRIGSTKPCSTNTVGPWYFKNALQAISELASTLPGVDWEEEPVEPYTDNLGTVLAVMNIAPFIGEERPNAVFEFGDGKVNVGEFREVRDATGNENRNYSLPPSFPNAEATELLEQYDWPAILASQYIYEDVIPSSIVTTGLRNQLLQSNILVRKNPKSVLTFTPTNDPRPGVMPQYGEDFEVGDIVGFRAVEYGKETFNGLCRVYEAQFVVDDLGNETMTPILIEQET